MEFQKDTDFNNPEPTPNTQSVNIDFSKTEKGINEISTSFWEEINTELKADDLPLWRMWR